MKFNVISNSGLARAGLLKLNNINIKTPVFMPVATYGYLKSFDISQLYNMGIKIILSNIFHLINHPGLDIISLHNGIHNFMNWNGLILTDSGGFQMFSLKRFIKPTNHGIYFRSFNNKKIFISPEISVFNQEKIGSNIIMSFDECLNFTSEYQAKKSLDLSLRWAEQSKKAHSKKSILFGIIQGGNYINLRKKSLYELKKINFDGYAIGGLSVGESKKNMLNVLDNIVYKMPTDKPRYLMGVGKPEDIIESVLRGVDMFDCVIPTRNARNGYFYTFHGVVKIKNSINKYNISSIDKNCKCYCCRNFTLSYLYHLYNMKDSFGFYLGTLHNIYFYNDLMTKLRLSIINNKIDFFVNNFYQYYHIERYL